MGGFTLAGDRRSVARPRVINVPELLETRSDWHVVLRGSSVQLVALLESGDVDYALEYESVARQHGLEYVQLPGSIDLGDPVRRDLYGTVEVKLDFQRFASVRRSFAAT